MSTVSSIMPRITPKSNSSSAPGRKEPPFSPSITIVLDELAGYPGLMLIGKDEYSYRLGRWDVTFVKLADGREHKVTLRAMRPVDCDCPGHRLGHKRCRHMAAAAEVVARW